MRLDPAESNYVPVAGINTAAINIQPEEQQHTPMSPIAIVTIAAICAVLGGGIGAITSLIVAKPIINKIQGEQGKPGVDGKSAYDIAVDNGYNGSEQQWIGSLHGAKGDQGLTGNTGDTGLTGATGATGTVADLSSIPGWPAGCNSPKIVSITVPINGVDTKVNTISCG